MKLTALTLTVAGSLLFGGTDRASASNYTSTQQAVCAVFKNYCGQAMKIVGCETGGTYAPWAANGQYLGIFQMGSHERATYGHGPDVWSQARAAFRYFIASGRNWSPWLPYDHCF